MLRIDTELRLPSAEVMRAVLRDPVLRGRIGRLSVAAKKAQIRGGHRFDGVATRPYSHRRIIVRVTRKGLPKGGEPYYRANKRTGKMMEFRRYRQGYAQQRRENGLPSDRIRGFYTGGMLRGMVSQVLEEAVRIHFPRRSHWALAQMIQRVAGFMGTSSGERERIEKELATATTRGLDTIWKENK